MYELVTLTLQRGSMRNKQRFAEILARIEAFANAGADGVLLGCWTTEFGPQNQIRLMRSFRSLDGLRQDRERVLHSPEPFVPAAILASINLETFVQFGEVPPVQPGSYGPYYEFRTYTLRIGGLAPTKKAWKDGIPARVALSPLVVVMHALDGIPRFVHVWGYRSLADREKIRAEAFATGVWPAPGAPEWLTEIQQSELLLPTAISQLT